jgi:L-cysteate sulfo-lyase
LNGNVLLDRLHGASVSKREGGADMNAEMAALANKLLDQGKKPYIIPGGGSNPIGALGYVNCVRELAEQAASTGLHIDALVHATGSSGTQAGLVAGLAAIQNDMHLLGIGVRAPQPKQEQMVFDLAQRTADYLDTGLTIPRSAVRANCDYVGPGYGMPTEGMITALKLLAETEGLLFDPVYSGKGLDGLIDQIRKGYFDGMDNIVFLHTGGSAALFGYPDTFGLPGYTD